MQITRQPDPAVGTVPHIPAPRRSRPDAPYGELDTALNRLSGGNVLAAPAAGPVLRAWPRRRRVDHHTYVPVLSPRDRLVVAVLSLAWLGCLVAFWFWWFQPGHRVGPVGTIVNSALLLYLSILPANLIIAVNRLRRFDPAIAVPDVRTAFVVTRAPSEPWATARTTLTAMLDQDHPYPYDVWLCDENPSVDILGWCAAHGVSVSNRRDEAAYHRPVWPRRTRCKEGNLAWFYDTHGYDRYDVVVQLARGHQDVLPHPTILLPDRDAPAVRRPGRRLRRRPERLRRERRRVLVGAGPAAPGGELPRRVPGGTR